jgi:rubrerythrin
MKCDRVPYVSREEAREYVTNSKRSRKLRVPLGNVRPYQCERCGYWHLGKKAKRRVG